MLSRLTRGQVAVFTILAMVTLTYASVTYVKLPRLLGIGRYEISVELPNTADLYPNAVVTLNGVDIGAVQSLTLSDNGVIASLLINNGVGLPAESTVSVRSISAIGEQYLNFKPMVHGGRTLQPGEEVPSSKVQLPPPISDVVDSANRLVASLPPADLNTAIRELSTAFSGSAGSLNQLISSSTSLLATAEENLKPTQQLIDNLGPVLDTQARLSPEIRSSARDLGIITEQLRKSDSDLRGTLDQTGGFADSIDGLVVDIGPTLPVLLKDLTQVSQVLEVYLPNIRHGILVLPVTNNEVVSATYNGTPGTLSLYFKAVAHNPPPCTVGFEGDRQRNANDLSPTRPAAGAYCKVPKDSPMAVRGGRNYPCPNDPALTSFDAAGCGLNFQSQEEATRQREEAIQTQLDVARTLPTTGAQPRGAPPPDILGGPSLSGAAVPSVATYDESTGMMVAPDGKPFILGAHGDRKPNEPDWRYLLLDPVGLARR